jgi:hypothetical protein
MLKIELTISSDWPRIATVRQAVVQCVSAVFQDPALCHDLAMTSAELLENAVKYGVQGEVVFSLSYERGAVEVRVANSVNPTSGNLEALKRRLDWIFAFGDPSEAYIAAMEQVALAANPERASSGLGLVRIISEGGCSLECDATERGRVVMSAKRPVQVASAGRSS